MLQRRLKRLVFMIALGSISLAALGWGSGESRSGVSGSALELPKEALPVERLQPEAIALTQNPTLTFQVFLPVVMTWQEPDRKSWWMAGANPQRTSWTEEEVRGRLQPVWYRPIEPYIPAKVQIIATNGLLYVSTASGLYALDAETGAERWVYATEMPLGHSPTVINEVAYVGGLDHQLHAVDALTGSRLWTFEAGAGFDTNPLVVNGLVYAGNRDGYLYAIYDHDSPVRGTLAWKYQSGGPIHFSAAYQNGTVYFASNDAYAYALNAATGALIWKSAKLPTGDGFHSWWPVVNGNYVIFSGSRGYRNFTPPQTGWSSDFYTKGDAPLFDAACAVSNSEPLGSILPDGRMDFSSAAHYLESRPWRRIYYLLNAATGQEVTYDFDHDGLPTYAPLLNTGTNSGTRYPALIGPDGLFYTFNHYTCNYGHVTGWQAGASSITLPSSRFTAVDEPLAYAAGGNVIYWNHCCDRSAGAFDLTGDQEWVYFEYDLDQLVPGYDVKYTGAEEARAVAVYGGWNGVYGSHGDQNPPIPYQGKVYLHRSNAIIALGAEGGAQALPMSLARPVSDPLPAVDVEALKQQLAAEVQKIIAAGHLRPGYGALGSFARAARSEIGDNFADYWSNPADTLLVLTAAMPHLSPTLQQSLKTYLQNEFNTYSPCAYTHIGWKTGAAREAFDLPPEVTADMPNWPATMWSTFDFDGWTGPPDDWRWPPHTFYALWKYAQVFGGAKSIFDSCEERLWTPPSDATLAEYPFAHNAWIAGYIGYLELQKLAGYPEDSTKRATLNRLLSLRASAFTKDNPRGPDAHHDGQLLSVARNFIYLTPELGDYLRTQALAKVQAAYHEYQAVAPYWFVTRYEAAYNENVMQPLYDYQALFAAKALIFEHSRQDLARYLDVPAFVRGDLFYLQNLIYTIEAQQQ
ncbi:Serine/threonine-protein kinase AfsK [Thermoflexales bacterium]|nr:Serine/threonine-protein kinase AfsK [Thermoflexales bacterium]